MATTLAGAIPDSKPQLKEALMTLAEKWMADGEAKGRAEGKAEGKAEALRKLLTLKFGQLPEPATASINAATPADLDRWLDQVLAADSLQTLLDS